MIPQEWEVGVGEWMLTEKGCKEEVRIGETREKGERNWPDRERGTVDGNEDLEADPGMPGRTRADC